MKNMVNLSSGQWPRFNPYLLGTPSTIMDPKKVSYPLSSSPHRGVTKA